MTTNEISGSASAAIAATSSEMSSGAASQRHRGEVPCSERAPGAGLQIRLKARSGGFIRKLDRHDDPPGSMLQRISARPGVVPLETFIDVGGAPDIVTRRVALAPQNVDESSADAAHGARSVASFAPVKEGQNSGECADEPRAVRGSWVL